MRRRGDSSERVILLKRRKAIPLIGPFFALLIKLTGCGGGGGTSTPTSTVQGFDFAVTINGTSKTIRTSIQNPTIIELTRELGAAVELEGDRVIAIDGVRDTKSRGDSHWRYRDGSELIQEPATSHRLTSRQLTWHYETTGE